MIIQSRINVKETLHIFLIALGAMIQTINKIIINISSKRSCGIGLIPKTLKEEDKKYIKSMKLKL